MDLSVVIAVYNEQRIVEQSVLQLCQDLSHAGLDFELVIVNDGSTDGTEEVLRKVQQRLPQLRIISYAKNVGKGFAIKQGIVHAKGNMVLYTDIDLAYGPRRILDFYDEMQTQSIDGIIGSRMAEGSQYIISSGTINRALVRYLFSRIFNAFVRVMFNIPLKDTQCGIKCFKATVARKMVRVQRMHSYCFDVELLVIACTNRFAIKESPVSVTYTNARSHVRIVRHSAMMLFDLCKIKINTWRKRYLLEC